MKNVMTIIVVKNGALDYSRAFYLVCLVLFEKERNTKSLLSKAECNEHIDLHNNHQYKVHNNHKECARCCLLF